MSDILNGTVFANRYIVQSPVGNGGMATVYKGIDSRLDRQVAIKVMLPQYASDPAFAQRFKQEARAAAALQNPYIVQVYDWGKDDASGTYFIVMEYLRGTDLKSGIRSHGALAPKKVAQIGAQVCSALAVAHSHDIIHRDIKPQNIMVLPNGDAKVMDFGIARAKNSHLTQTNSVLGTAHYVSPEQAQGKELGPASDLYSLGVVMYEAATGRLPFEGDDAVSVALKQVNEQPVPPSRVNPNIDPALESIIMRLMLKDPSQRFQTADQLRHVLNAYIQGKPVNLGPLPTQGTQRVRPNQPTAVLPTNPSQTARQQPTGRTSPQSARTARMDRTNPPANQRQPQRQPSRADNRRRIAEDSNKSTMIGIVVIALVLAALVGFGLFALNSCSTGTGDKTPAGPTIDTTKQVATVPSLANLTQQEAKNRLESYGFTLGLVTTEPSNTVTQGKVISQSPAANTQQPEGTAINIVVSGGSELISFSDIRGMSPDQARSFIEGAGLTLMYDATLDGYSDTYPAGTIGTYSPANQKVAKGSTVSYGLSKGPESISVPDVLNWWYGDAQTAMANAGLQYKTEWEYSSDVASECVIRTDPAARSMITRSTVVTIYVSQGAEPVNVGDYYGWNINDANAHLQGLGLVCNAVQGDPAPSADVANLVYWTDPANTTVGKGSTVTLYYYGAYVDPNIYIGDYTGWSASSAASDLAGKGMVANVIYDMAPTDASLAYMVYYSEPRGTSLSPGSTVNLYAYGDYVAPAPAPAPTDSSTPAPTADVPEVE